MGLARHFLKNKQAYLAIQHGKSEIGSESKIEYRGENAVSVVFRYKDNKEGRMNSVFYLILQVKRPILQILGPL